MAQDNKVPKVFDPASLSVEEAELVVEHYLGLHPKYFVLEQGQVKADMWKVVADGKQFNGFIPHALELRNITEEQFRSRWNEEGIKSIIDESAKALEVAEEQRKEFQKVVKDAKESVSKVIAENEKLEADVKKLTADIKKLKSKPGATNG